MGLALDDLRDLAVRVGAAERALADARRERDDAVRELRQAARHTVPELAAAAGVSQATVKSIIRGLR
jgi:DNA-binding MurR/RpiR family transcriptional regulator